MTKNRATASKIPRIFRILAISGKLMKDLRNLGSKEMKAIDISRKLLKIVVNGLQLNIYNN